MENEQRLRALETELTQINREQKELELEEKLDESRGILLPLYSPISFITFYFKSWINRLLGKPSTLNEFIAKCQTKGLNKIEILYEWYDDDNLFGLPKYHVLIFVESSNMRFKVAEFIHERRGHLFETEVAKAQVARETVREALKIQTRLQDLGFEVEIIPCPSAAPNTSKVISLLLSKI